MNKKRNNRIFRLLVIVFAAVLVFSALDFCLSEIADTKAYEDAVRDDEAWAKVAVKIISDEKLSDEDYATVLSQTGLGRPATDKLISEGELAEIEKYREYYLKDKEYYCYRKGVFACHEAITDTDGQKIYNPGFADLQKGDIIITLSIHSLGYRHGHATIVTDAENGIGVQAVMVGEKSNNTYLTTWSKYPLVAVLRPKNVDEVTRIAAGQFAQDNLKGIYYSLLGGVFTGRDTEKAPITTQCAHLVWYAYMTCGVDIAPESGHIITPKDFLYSENLEIVQVYGNITEV